MGERVAFEDLTTELANVRAKVERWAYNKMSSADEMKSAYQRHVVEHKSRVQQLETRRQQLRAQADSLRQRLEEQGGEEAALREELEQVLALEEAIPMEIKEMQDLLEVETEARRRAEQAFSKDAADQDKKLNALRGIEAAYSKRTGLRFEYSEDGAEDLQLIFTCIDPQDPAREFMFAVHVTADTHYVVTKCEPPLLCMPALVAELNANKDKQGTDEFGSFVRKVRARFQQLVLPSEAPVATA